MIPILDLKAQYLQIKEEINDAIQDVLSSTQFILGPAVKDLEERIAEYCECRYAIGVASGTDALRLALAALDIGPGDEVITTPFTFIATANVISRCGAEPIFADIDPSTYNIDPCEIEDAVTERTRVIIPVHFYGLPAEMDGIMALAEKYNLAVIEDAAQAFGASYKSRKVGSLGHIGCFSFYPSKNLGAYGDGGMVVTHDRDFADKVDILRRQGCMVKYHADVLGFNSRLDSLQAAILGVKLNYLDDWNKARRRIASRYNRLFTGLPVRVPWEPLSYYHVYHQYTVRVEGRDGLQNHLAKRDIETRVYYPVPLHLQKVYADLGYSLPESEKASREVLSLPMYPELTEGQQDKVVNAVWEFFRQ